MERKTRYIGFACMLGPVAEHIVPSPENRDHPLWRNAEFVAKFHDLILILRQYYNAINESVK